jgi:hypothetical protein
MLRYKTIITSLKGKELLLFERFGDSGTDITALYKK